jgi:hypothetical protein
MFDRTLKFVYFTTNRDMLRIMSRLLRRGKNWSVQVTDDKEHFKSLISDRPDILLIGPGADTNDIRSWQTLSKSYGSTLIEHFGGGSGLLYNEIQQYLDSLEQS